jgi:hypothetical protein
MVYNTQHYCVFGLCPSSGGPVIEVSSFLGTQQCRCLPSPEDRNRPSFRNAVFSSFKNTGRRTKSKNPVILSGMNLRVICSQTIEFDNAKHFSVSHCSFKVDSAQTRIRKQQWVYS